MTDSTPPPGHAASDHAEAPEVPSDDTTTDATAPQPTQPKPKRRIGIIIAITLLSLGLIAVGVVLTLALLQLDKALNLIDDQQRELERQQELIDEKETFSQAATEMMQTAAQFDGLPYSTIIDTNYHRVLIERGWTHRWNAGVLRNDIADVRAQTAKLASLADDAAEQRASNQSGTFYEEITDQLGQGYVTSVFDRTQEICDLEAWGCVQWEEPFTIHYDHAGTSGKPYMTDWIRTGVAYHEYAHVLQFANPLPTEKAAAAFGGDWETMADCYVLTYLDGWKLDHRIWVNSYQYWDVSVGYGYTCNSDQRQVIREWVESLGYRHAPISQ